MATSLSYFELINDTSVFTTIYPGMAANIRSWYVRISMSQVPFIDDLEVVVVCVAINYYLAMFLKEDIHPRIKVPFLFTLSSSFSFICLHVYLFILRKGLICPTLAWP